LPSGQAVCRLGGSVPENILQRYRYVYILLTDVIGLNTKITKDTDLSPFWDSQSSLVTSANCQLTNKYNYTYPEFAKPNGLSSDEAYQKIAELYGGEHRPTFLLAEAKRAATETKIATLPTPTPKKQSIFDRFHLHIPGFKRKKPKSSAPQKLPAAPATSLQQVGRDQEPTVGTYQDWVVNITLEKFALQGMGYVIVFLGPEQEIPSNESEWQTCPIYVGSVNVFASNPDHSECQSCKRQKESGLRVGGSVYLTNTLIDKHVPLIGQAPVDYLKVNLHWRLKDDSDREKSREDVPSLKVLVSSVGYEIGPDGKLAKKNWVRQVEITRDKAGGVKNADDF
jgi:tyrosinase